MQYSIMLYISSPELTHLKIESLYPLTSMSPKQQQLNREKERSNQESREIWQLLELCLQREYFGTSTMTPGYLSTFFWVLPLPEVSMYFYFQQPRPAALFQRTMLRLFEPLCLPSQRLEVPGKLAR